MTAFGCQDMVGEIERVMLMHPREAFVDQESIDAQWQAAYWVARPHFDKALDEYDRFVDLLRQFCMEVEFLPQNDATGIDAIYTRDPLLISNKGVILCKMANSTRQPEPDPAAAFLESKGIPVLGAITGEGKLEGGDVVWLDERTVAVGEGYRTNAEGIRQLKQLLGDAVDEVISVPLPYWTGPDECLHLMSILSPVDVDLALVYSKLMAVPFRELLLARGIKLLEVPDDEYDTLACNVLAVAPRKCVMLAGNPVTKRMLEDEGAQVWEFAGEEICLAGNGGPTCLTQPILRVPSA